MSRSTWVSDSRRMVHFAYRTFTVYGQPFQDCSTMYHLCNFPTDPEIDPVRPHDTEYTTLPGLTYIRFGLFPVRSPLLGKSLLFSLPEATKMFQFASFASVPYVFRYRCPGITRNGFPHSEISGSKLVSSSPKLIAACHVFHRLSIPRHPLNSLVRCNS